MATRVCRPVTIQEHTEKAKQQFEEVTGRSVRAGVNLIEPTPIRRDVLDRTRGPLPSPTAQSSDMILALNYAQGTIDADTLRINATLISRPAREADEITGLAALPDREESIFDIYLENLLIKENMADAGRATASDVAAIRQAQRKHLTEAAGQATEQAGIPMPKDLNKALRANLFWMGLIREGVMISPARVLSAATLDAMGNSWFQLLAGHPASAVRSLNPRHVVAIAKHTMRGGELKHPTMELYRALNMDVNPSVIDVATRDLFDISHDTNMSRFFSVGGKIPGGKAASRPFASLWGRSYRHGVDQNARLFLLGSEFRRATREKQIALFMDWRGRYGDEVAQGIIDEVGSAIPTPEQVRQAIRNAGLGGDTADDMARRWRADLSDADKAAVREVERVHFKMRATKADEVLRHVMLFHFWQSRASVFYARTVLGNPYLLYNHIQLYEALDKEAERQGVDGVMRLYFKFMKSEAGWFFQMDPLSYIVPYTMMRDWAIEYNGESAFDKWSRRFGAFVHPGISAALSIVGGSDQFPTLLPNATRTAVTGVWNWMRNHGYDLGFGPGISGDPITELERRVMNGINDLLADKGLARDVEPFDPTTTDRMIVMDLIIRQAEQDFGMTYDEMLAHDDPRYRDAVLQAQIALMTGQPNERAEKALAEWSTWDQAAAVAVRAVVPGYLPVRSEVHEERKAENRGSYEGEPTAEGENAQVITQQVMAGSPEAATLQTENEAYQRLGTPDQQTLSKGWAIVAFEVLPRNAVQEIGGVEYYGWQLNAMTRDQRMKLADAWVLDEMGRMGIEDVDPENNEFTQYRDERSQFAAESEELPGYQDYLKRGREYDGGERIQNIDYVTGDVRLPEQTQEVQYETRGGMRAFRAYLEDVSPNYARAIDAERQRLMGNGITGEELERRLDQWANSVDGYNAYRGVKSELGDKDPLPTFDPEQQLPPPGPGESVPEQSGSDASGNGGSGTSSQNRTSGQRPQWQQDLVIEVAEYGDLIADFESEYGPMSNMTSPYGQKVIDQFFRQSGFEPSRNLTQYLNWAEIEFAEGRDGSIEAYLAYRDAEFKKKQANA